MKRERVNFAEREERGFSLIEIVIALSILAVLAVGVIPLAKTQVKRQKERQLRTALREMRDAIDEFHRDAQNTPCSPGAAATGGGQPLGPVPQNGVFRGDPKSAMMITDCTIFQLENVDRYPPKLETLVEGVTVKPRNPLPPQQGGGGNPVDTNRLQVTTNLEKKKYYLPRIPIDPMTGKAEWDVRSSYDEPDRNSSGGENVFDVRSKSTETALDGSRYSEW